MSRFLDKVSDWFRRQHEREYLQSSNSMELSDAGISRSDFMTALTAPPDTRERMMSMAASFGLPSEAIDKDRWLALDTARACAQCGDRAACKRWLNGHEDTLEPDDFCPNAARYAGMNITLSTVMAMSLSGALAGLAGTNEVLGLNHNLAMAFSSGYGFDAIALALLGKSHPLGVVLASLLFGTMRNGATRMQLSAGIPIDIISVLQAMILAFIAAPAIIRTVYRLKEAAVEDEGVRVRGWGGD